MDLSLSLSLPSLARRSGGGGFTPLNLYRAGDILAWYDPSDLTTLFQDTAGTTPVTADGQSVALIRDKGPGGYHRTQATGPSMPKYKTNGTLHWLLYDGSDDGNVTASINWSTDEVAFCAGLTKASDAAAGLFAEFGTGSAAGMFSLFAPPFATPRYRFSSRGSAAIVNADTPASFAASNTSVVTGLSDISTDALSLRVNAVEQVSVSTDQGTGNFGNYALYFGRRGGTSFPFNGREYQTVIRSRLLSVAERTQLETFVAAKTGVTL